MQRALLVCACVVALAGCGDEGEEATTTTEPATPAQESSPLRERLDRLVGRLLDERGLDPAVAECALAELSQTVPDAQLRSAIAAIRETGAPPPGVTEAAAAAGEACGRQ